MVCHGVQNSGGRGYAARRDDSAEALPGTHALWPVEYSTVGSLMGGLLGGNLWIEGLFARLWTCLESARRRAPPQRPVSADRN
jgi:hypothetical protein